MFMALVIFLAVLQSELCAEQILSGDNPDESHVSAFSFEFRGDSTTNPRTNNHSVCVVRRERVLQ